jgi:hypothetical protein
VVFDFSNLSEIGSTLKNQNGCLILLQKFPIFACDLSCSKNPRTDSTFKSLMNFKRDLNLPEKSGKFSKILS